MSTIRTVLAFLLLMVAQLSAADALAQGFMVKPMRMDATPLPGQPFNLTLQVWNTAAGDQREIELRLVDISQDRAGGLTLFEGAAPPPPTSSSAVNWIALDSQRVSIAAQDHIEIGVTVRPPTDARGTYVAGIVVETPQPDDVTGVVVRTRFLVPVLIQIQGRSVQQRVNLAALSMDAFEEAQKRSTRAGITVVNDGQTYSRVRGQLTIERQDGERWRPITKLELAERGILPGVTLDLTDDIGRTLPGGNYRLHGEIFVDGRRVAPKEQIVDFVGDPNASAAYDATLTLNPQIADLKVVPGATRTMVMRIQNTSEDPVTIDMASVTPKGLIGVELGDLQGVRLSAQPFVTVTPASFVLRPNASQNVRVVTSLPKDDAEFPFYYADLVLKGTYADGQSAGETLSSIRLANGSVEPKVSGVIDQVSLSVGSGPSELISQMRFANQGTADVTTRASVEITTLQGRMVRRAVLDGDPGTLLPLNLRVFSGELSLDAIEAGQYILTALVDTEKQKFSRRYALDITMETVQSAAGQSVDIPAASIREIAQ